MLIKFINFKLQECCKECFKVPFSGTQNVEDKNDILKRDMTTTEGHKSLKGRNSEHHQKFIFIISFTL